MRVRVKLFAWMAERAGVREAELEVGEKARVGEMRGMLLKQFPEMPWPAGTMVAVNQEYAREESVLVDGDEVAVIPPVSGG